MKLIVNSEIVLKTPKVEFADAIYTFMMKDKNELKSIFGFINDEYKLQDEFNFINNVKKDEFVFYVFYQNKACGKIGLYDYNPKDQSTSIFYYISSSYRRKHIAINSAKKLLDYAFNELHMNIVNFYINEFNQSSIRLAKKLNGNYLGLLKDNDYVNGKYHNQHHYQIIKL